MFVVLSVRRLHTRLAFAASERKTNKAHYLVGLQNVPHVLDFFKRAIFCAT